MAELRLRERRGEKHFVYAYALAMGNEMREIERAEKRRGSFTSLQCQFVSTTCDVWNALLALVIPSTLYELCSAEPKRWWRGAKSKLSTEMCKTNRFQYFPEFTGLLFSLLHTMLCYAVFWDFHLKLCTSSFPFPAPIFVLQLITNRNSRPRRL